MRAIVAASLLLCASSALAAPVQWIEDDWQRAEEEARARGVPVVVEAWAPW